jgi:hypothetical protein
MHNVKIHYLFMRGPFWSLARHFRLFSLLRVVVADLLRCW